VAGKLPRHQIIKKNPPNRSFLQKYNFFSISFSAKVEQFVPNMGNNPETALSWPHFSSNAKVKKVVVP